jgi:hypothetical protein
MHTLKEICAAFNLNEQEIVNVYAYGSRIYGTHNTDSDHDYIVVFKAAMLPSGAFKENAKSSEDRKIQIIPYSRGGFKAGLEQYDISCIECLYLPTNMVIQKKWPFKIEKINLKEFADKIISKVSASWHSAGLALSDGHYYHAKKGYYHAIRIADFAMQLKTSNFTTIDFTTAKLYWNEISNVNDQELKHYIKHKMYGLRDQMFLDLKA